jgi:hypothetical protein
LGHSDRARHFGRADPQFRKFPTEKTGDDSIQRVIAMGIERVD